MKFGYNWPSSFREEIVDRWMDGRMTESAYTIGSSGAFCSGEL